MDKTASIKLYAGASILYFSIVAGLLFAIGINVNKNARVAYCKSQTGIADDKCDLSDYAETSEVSSLYIAASVFAAIAVGLFAFLASQMSIQKQIEQND